MKHQPPSIYFLHISKTAGSSFASIIRCAYPQTQGMPVYEIPELLKLNREEINKFKCFTGHFGTGLFSLLDREISCVTMLRDPFERAVSSIHFAKKIAISSALPALNDRLQAHARRETFKNPLEAKQVELKKLLIEGNLREIVNDPVLSKMIENMQTLYLGYDLNLNSPLDNFQNPVELNDRPTTNIELFFVQQLLYGLDMDKMLDRAKQRLDKMAVVGILEQFDNSARSICNFLGVDTPENLPQENISPEKRSLGKLTYRESGKIPDDVIRRIDELTAYDREVYEHGKKIFARQLRHKKKRFFWF